MGLIPGTRITLVTPSIGEDLATTLPVRTMVGVRGFEPPAPASRKQCSTRLSYTPPTGPEI